MKLHVSYAIERGKNKQECEDTGLIGHVVANNASGELITETPSSVFICDGVGGNAGGQEASRFVCDAISQSIIPDTIENARAMIQAINSRLLSRAEQTAEHKTMATTATGLLITDHSFILCHIGDTRLYTQQGESLQQVTADHTVFQMLMNLGKEEEARHCSKEAICGAMGGGDNRLIDLLEVKTVFEREVPSLLLLTTDGIHDYLSEDEMEEIITDSKDSDLEKAGKLCKAALNHQSEDDRSAIVIRPEDTEVQ